MTRVSFIAVLFLLLLIQLPLGSPVYAEQENPQLRNPTCLMCHGRENFSMPGVNGEIRNLHVIAEQFGESVHGGRDCVNCHKDITQVPPQKGIDRQVGCVQCHQDLWAEAEDAGTTEEHARLGEVVEQIESYMGSIHARPSIKV